MGKLSHAKTELALLGKQKQRTKTNKKKKEPLKITYISSPTLVKATNASEFRALVQELTGKNSRVGEDDEDEYSETYNNYSPVIMPSPVAETTSTDDNSVEDHRVPGSYTSSSLDEFDYGYLEGSDGYFSNGSSNAIAATAAEGVAGDGGGGSYSAAEMEEEGGFSLWRDVPDAFGNGGGGLQYSLNCVFV